MNGWWYVAPILIVTAVVGIFESRPARAFVAIAIVATAQVVAIVLGEPSWRGALAVSLFYVLTPWAVVAVVIHFLRSWKLRRLVAAFVPLAYFLGLGLGIVVGDGTGLLAELAGVRVDHLGNPAPLAIVVDDGKCEAVQRATTALDPISYTECGVSVGVRRFTVKCADPNLPKAEITWDIPAGSSHYVQFRDACSTAAAGIIRENARRRTISIWDPKYQ